jgi:hypothetical protein
MYRYKRIIGGRLRSKLFDSQKREALIAVNAINRMTALGMPESVKVAALGRVDDTRRDSC